MQDRDDAVGKLTSQDQAAGAAGILQLLACTLDLVILSFGMCM